MINGIKPVWDCRRIQFQLFKSMDDETRVARLTSALKGTGARILGPFQVWALEASVTDAHLAEIAEWADLVHLMLKSCPISDACLSAIFRFSRLESLDISATGVTSNALATTDLPKSIRDIGLANIKLNDDAAHKIAKLPSVRGLNCNGCDLSLDAFLELVAAPCFRSIEALSCAVPDNVARSISQSKPKCLLRLDSGVWQNGEIRRRLD